MKFQSIDKLIAFKIDHQDKTEFLSLLDFRIQVSPTGKIYTSFYKKTKKQTTLKSSLWISNQHFHSVPKQNTLVMQFTTFAARNKKITRNVYLINTLKNINFTTSISRHLNNNKSLKLHTHSNTSFLKLPHFYEIITKEIRKAIY